MSGIPNEGPPKVLELFLEELDVGVPVEGEVQAVLGGARDDGPVLNAVSLDGVFVPSASAGCDVVRVLKSFEGPAFVVVGAVHLEPVHVYLWNLCAHVDGCPDPRCQ